MYIQIVCCLFLSKYLQFLVGAREITQMFERYRVFGSRCRCSSLYSGDF